MQITVHNEGKDLVDLGTDRNHRTYATVVQHSCVRHSGPFYSSLRVVTLRAEAHVREPRAIAGRAGRESEGARGLQGCKLRCVY